jgi:cytochrome b561
MAMDNDKLKVSGKMQISQSAYTSTARVFHWLVAILIIGMLPLGWYMMSIEDDPGSDWYFMLHKSIGLLVLAFALLRLLWRFGHQPGSLPEQLPQWQVKASKISHWLLYVLMIAMPVAGLTGALFSKGGVAFFGSQLPRVFAANHDLAELFFSAHSVIAWALVGVISLHVLAALKHLLVDKDGVFQRMWS